ncbi:MAG: hypothetical protein JNM31_12745 [Flavobacteriales bacterium]|nr:hypothetical protein [Flavobacteriales bacterium]
MNEPNPALELARIRGLMDRSTRFLSLSGLSGIWAGLMALGGALAAHRYITAFTAPQHDPITYGPVRGDQHYEGLLWTLVTLAALVLVTALLGAFWFTWRRASRSGTDLWDASARRLLVNLALPLIAGGLYCLALLWHGLPGTAMAATLVFYGLALLNASKYTLDEIRWLGLSEAALGVMAAFWPSVGLFFWGLGFGVLHIVYGALMYMRYERTQASA